MIKFWIIVYVYVDEYARLSEFVYRDLATATQVKEARSERMYDAYGEIERIEIGEYSLSYLPEETLRRLH